MTNSTYTDFATANLRSHQQIAVRNLQTAFVSSLDAKQVERIEWLVLASVARHWSRCGRLAVPSTSSVAAHIQLLLDFVGRARRPLPKRNYRVDVHGLLMRCYDTARISHLVIPIRVNATKR